MLHAPFCLCRTHVSGLSHITQINSLLPPKKIKKQNKKFTFNRYSFFILNKGKMNMSLSALDCMVRAVIV